MPGGVGDDGVVTCDMPREKMARRLSQERCAVMSEKRNGAYATSEESLSSARPSIHSVALSSDWVQVVNETHTAPSTLRQLNNGRPTFESVWRLWSAMHAPWIV